MVVRSRHVNIIILALLMMVWAPLLVLAISSYFILHLDGAPFWEVIAATILGTTATTIAFFPTTSTTGSVFLQLALK
eukprot:10790436-Ditylum_brightwellii.AAC.1